MCPSSRALLPLTPRHPIQQTMGDSSLQCSGGNLCLRVSTWKGRSGPGTQLHSRVPAQQVLNAQHQKELLEKSHLRGSITRCPTAGVEKERQTKMKAPEGMETKTVKAKSIQSRLETPRRVKEGQVTYLKSVTAKEPFSTEGKHGGRGGQ